ncbi:hypothetical protein ETC05_16485 [Geobacillus sp. BMUD]|nr:hypothetical protein [Geobacillus sp. BMUD]
MAKITIFQLFQCKRLTAFAHVDQCVIIQRWLFVLFLIFLLFLVCFFLLFFFRLFGGFFAFFGSYLGTFFRFGLGVRFRLLVNDFCVRKLLR